MAVYPDHAESIPVLDAVGSKFMVTSQQPIGLVQMLHTVPSSENGGTTTVVSFVDDLGKPVKFANITYSIVAQCETETVRPDEDTKAVGSVTLLNASNWATGDVVNVIVCGRLENQPEDGNVP